MKSFKWVASPHIGITQRDLREFPVGPTERTIATGDEAARELRVTRTGVAICSACCARCRSRLASSPSTTPHGGSTRQRLLLAAASFAVLIAPLALTAVLLPVADRLLARGVAMGRSAVFGLLIATLWFVPALLRRRR